jgi:transposase
VAERQHVLAAVRRVGAGRLLAAAAPGAARPARRARRHRLVPRGRRQRELPGQKGGAHTGPSPTDRGKRGCKRHVVTDAGGLPLLVVTTPANVRDDAVLPQLLDDLPPVLTPAGRRRYRPAAVVGDRGYGFPHVVRQVRARRVASLLAPRGAPHGSGLGRVRYVVERTLGWAAAYRRVAQCVERTGRSWQAMNELACCLICANRLRAANRAERLRRMVA